MVLGFDRKQKILNTKGLLLAARSCFLSSCTRPQKHHISLFLQCFPVISLLCLWLYFIDVIVFFSLSLIQIFFSNLKCFLCLHLMFVASLHLSGAVKEFHHILHSWENVVDYKYTCNSWSILSILRLLKRSVFWVLINWSWKRILENYLNCHPMPPFVVNVSWMWLVMPGIQNIAIYPECIVMLSTWGWGPQLFRIFLSVHQLIPRTLSWAAQGLYYM